MKSIYIKIFNNDFDLNIQKEIIGYLKFEFFWSIFNRLYAIFFRIVVIYFPHFNPNKPINSRTIPG